MWAVTLIMKHSGHYRNSSEPCVFAAIWVFRAGIGIGSNPHRSPFKQWTDKYIARKTSPKLFFSQYIYTYPSTMDDDKRRLRNDWNDFPSNPRPNVRQRYAILKRRKRKKKKRLSFATSFIIFPLFHGLETRLRTHGWIFQRG